MQTTISESFAAEACLKTVDLTRERYAIQYGIRLANIDVDATLERVGASLFVRLFNDVYCAKKTKAISITVPDTWADSFRLRWYPKWLLNRYPAKMRTITETVEARALFPELDSPNNEHRMVFAIYDKKDTFYK